MPRIGIQTNNIGVSIVSSIKISKEDGQYSWCYSVSAEFALREKF